MCDERPVQLTLKREFLLGKPQLRTKHLHFRCKDLPCILLRSIFGRNHDRSSSIMPIGVLRISTARIVGNNSNMSEMISGLRSISGNPTGSPYRLKEMLDVACCGTA